MEPINLTWSADTGEFGGTFSVGDADRYFSLPIITINSALNNAGISTYAKITSVKLTATVYAKNSTLAEARLKIGYGSNSGINTVLYPETKIHTFATNGTLYPTIDLTNYITNSGFSPFALNTNNGNYITFNIWSENPGKKTYKISDVYLDVTYTIPTYTLTVKTNSDAYGTVTGGGTYENGATATLTATPKTGYKFVKWNDGNTSATRTVTVSGDATYTATFEGVTYYVAFDGNGATSGSVATITTKYGTNFTLPENGFTKKITFYWEGNGGTVEYRDISANAVFNGWKFSLNSSEIWQPGEKFANKSITDDATVTVYADWGSQTFTHPTATRTGYKFTGWNTKADGTGTPYTGSKISTSTNMTLYAQWERTYTVTASGENGTVTGDIGTFVEGYTAVLTATPNPGYKFVKWITNGHDYGDTQNPYRIAVNQNLTIIAVFEKLIYDIGYDNLFSLFKWVNSACSTVSNSTRGAVTYDIDTGIITITTDSTGENYTMYGASNDYYFIDVAPNTEYIFKSNITVDAGRGQMFVFFYDANGSALSGAIYNGAAQSNAHIGIYPGNGTHAMVFTTPQNCTKVGIRLGATDGGCTMATYSNIGFYNNADYVTYIKDYVKVREIYSVGDTIDLMTPYREGYSFIGWIDENGILYTNGSNLPLGSLTLYAQWEASLNCTIINNTTNSNVVLWMKPENQGVWIQVNSGEQINLTSQTYVTFWMEESEDYQFASWKIGNDNIYYDNPLTLLISKSIIIEAVSELLSEESKIWFGNKKMCGGFVKMPDSEISKRILIIYKGSEKIFGGFTRNQYTFSEDIFLGTTLYVGTQETNIETDFAYSVDHGLTEVIIPEGRTRIANYVFDSCLALTKVTIPSTMTSMGTGAFDSCSSLTEITYNGTKSQWNNISKYKAFDGDLNDITIHCTDGDINYVKMTISVSPEGSGSVTTSPEAVTATTGDTFYVKGGITNLVQFTAKANSGYKFSKWIYLDGDEVYTENPVSTSVPISTTMVAVFEAKWEYTQIEGGNAVGITGYNGIDGEIVIPTTLDGYPVKGIESEALAWNSNLISVTIPDSVIAIGESAFYWCDNLTDLTIGDNVTVIDKDAFYQCSSLTTLIIPASVTTLGDFVFGECTALTNVTFPNSITVIGEGVFYNCISLSDIYYSGTTAQWKAITIEGWQDLSNTIIHCTDGIISANDVVIDGVLYVGTNTTKIAEYAYQYRDDVTRIVFHDDITTIGAYAFHSCRNLTNVILPNGVTTLALGAFCGCDNLTDVTIPESVTSIGNNAFIWCKNLMTISVDENNTVYSSDSMGVLYNKSKTMLIQYPIGNANTSYNIPSGITEIHYYAFSKCATLTNIVIPDSLTAINGYIFENCTNLASVFVPDSVKTIHGKAFGGCISLTEIHYNGTKSQWMNITIVDDAFDDIGKITIHCSDGDINLANDTIIDGVLYIGTESASLETEYAFAERTDFTKVVIPEGKNIIARYCFQNCDLITEVLLPSTLTHIDSYAFGYCDSLEKINIPNNITYLGVGVFRECTNLGSGITIPYGIKQIQEQTFYACRSLVSITIPNSITTISSYALTGCSNLTDVYYNGSESQWNAISIHASNTSLTNANIHFDS